MDPGFKRLRYVRYADDFVIGLASTYSEAVELKERLTTFLKEKLELTLSAEKTLISHIEKDGFTFLGARVYRKKVDSRAGKPVKVNSIGRKVRITSELQVGAPIKRILSKLEENGFVRIKNHKLVACSFTGAIA